MNFIHGEKVVLLRINEPTCLQSLAALYVSRPSVAGHKSHNPRHVCYARVQNNTVGKSGKFAHNITLPKLSGRNESLKGQYMLGHFPAHGKKCK